MLLTYRKAEKATVVLNDLIKINNDRIIAYQQALDQATNLDIDVRNLFKQIIAEGQQLKQQLVAKVKQLEGNPTDGITISGLIHRAWVDLKVTFTGNTRNAIIHFCEYNEEVAQHAYKAALNAASRMGKDIQGLIEEQQGVLKCTYAAIRKCHVPRHYLNPTLVYFN